MLTDIIIVSKNAGLQTGHIDFLSNANEVLEKMKQNQKVTVCLIEDTCWDEMKKDTLNFIDKKVKHFKRQLTLYFTDKDEKAAFIDGRNYKTFSTNCFPIYYRS